MSDASWEDQNTQALRDGLAAQPVPVVSPDFDDHVLAALVGPGPWWHHWWEPVRPVLISASCALPATLALLHWSLIGPVPPPPSMPAVAGSVPARPPSLDALLDRPNLCAASLTWAWSVPSPAPPTATRRPEPSRHVESWPRPAVAA